MSMVSASGLGHTCPRHFWIFEVFWNFGGEKVVSLAYLDSPENMTFKKKKTLVALCEVTLGRLTKNKMSEISTGPDGILFELVKK